MNARGLTRTTAILALLGAWGVVVATGAGTADAVPSASSRATPDTGSQVFAVQADPHMDEQSDPAVYRATLRLISAAKPSFLVDLGDTFMVDKLADKSDANIRARYTLMRSYYALLGPDIPLYLALGNHDGEVGWDPLNTKSYRQQYLPASVRTRNYFAFTAPNSLFIVLDPYTSTTKKPNQDGWLWTLGKTQYDWLKTTLANSRAQHKYVFIHQLVGGDNQGRGGVEFANRYEWGGDNLDGTYAFTTRRPGWGKPIHQLLVDSGVDIVFKGHDHVYARQQLDGVTYQTVPQPSHPGDRVDSAANYGYRAGTIVGGSGYLRVTVRAGTTRVDFVRSTGKVAASYTVSG